MAIVKEMVCDRSAAGKKRVRPGAVFTLLLLAFAVFQVLVAVVVMFDQVSFMQAKIMLPASGHAVIANLQDFLQPVVQSDDEDASDDSVTVKETTDFETKSIWVESTILPDWIKEYFEWHQQQRKHLTRDNWHTKRYLVHQCMVGSKCGGTSDRLKVIPAVLWMAHRFQRILLIRWNHPARLEEFLQPPQGGMDWRVPDWLDPSLGSDPLDHGWSWNQLNRTLHNKSLTVVRSKFHDNGGGQELYDGMAFGPPFMQVYHDVWHTLFTPSPPVAALLRRAMSEMGLVPGRYAAAHCRALYAVKTSAPERIRQCATNAVTCASELRPGGPIYFASDSSDAVEFMQDYSRTHNRTIVSLIRPNDPLHLDKAPNWTERHPSEYYDTFVDLYLMGMSRCVAHNIGGFGQWGLMLGYNVSCSKFYQTRQPNACTWKDRPVSSVEPPPTLHENWPIRTPMK